MLINVLSVIIGVAGTIALSGTMSFTAEKTAYTNSTTAFLLAVFAICLLHYVYKQINTADKRGCVFSAAYSFLLSFAHTAGKQLHTVENFAIADIRLWIQIAVLTVFFWGFVWYLFQWLAGKCKAEKITIEDRQLKPQETENIKKTEDLKQSVVAVTGKKIKESQVKSFLLTWLIIFLCWIPVFLAFYPGAFVYDAQDEYVQVASRVFTTHHPLTHVLLLGGFVCLGNKFFGSYNIGIAMYTIFQMLVLSGIFAYTLSYLRTKLSKKICVAVTLFYGLFPVIPMYAVCSAKDTLFNGAFLLMLVQMLKLSEVLNSYRKNIQEEKDLSKDKAECRADFLKNNQWAVICKENVADLMVLIISAAAMMLFRNNGMYVVLVVTVILVVTELIKKLLKNKENRYLLIYAVAFAISLLFYKGVDTTLTFVLHADDSENQELLTVPIQQITRTYKYSPEVFSEEEKEVLYSYIPEDILNIYDADLSDLVKAHFNNERYAKNPSEFRGLWFDKFKEKPITYLNAWFMTSYGYWYPDTVINVYGGQQRFTFQYGESSYFGFETEQPGERDSKFPWLEEQYRKMSLEIYQQNVPGLSMLFSLGMLFWIFAFSLMHCMYQKKFSWLLPLGSIFLLWGTAILGPTFLVRYVLILWFALPLWSVLYYNDCGKVFLSEER